jgi:hypothetical protein
MLTTLLTLTLLLDTQTSTSTSTVDAAARTALALEKAAASAQIAAEAALRAAQAAEKIAGIKEPTNGALAVPGEAPPPSKWSGTVGFGLIWLAGNAETLTVSGNASTELKLEKWIFSAKANGVYGESLLRATDTNEVIARGAGILLRGDRRFTERVTGYLAGGSDFDHVKSIKYRNTGEAGSGITWLEDKDGELVTLSLRTDLAFRYQKETRYQYFPTETNLPDVELIAPRLGIAFRYAISKDLIFTQDAEAMPNVVGDSRLLFNSLSKIAVKLTQTLSFAVALDIKQDTRPAAGKEELDSALTIGLEVGL